MKKRSRLSGEGCCVSSQGQTVNDHVLVYVRKVQARFVEEPEKLVGMRRVMKDLQDLMAYRTKPDYEFVKFQGLFEDALERVGAILEGHRDLIDGFHSFLPESCRVVEVIDVGDEKEESVSAEKTTGEPPEFVNAMKFLRNMKARDKEIYEHFVRIFSGYKQKSKRLDDAYDEVLTLFSDNKDLQEEFSRFILVGVAEKQKQLIEENKGAKRGIERARKLEDDDGDGGGGGIEEVIRRQGIAFCKKVQERLSCSVSYIKFLKHFKDYSSENIDKDKLENMVEAMIGKYPDLMDDFKFFWMSCEDFYQSLSEEEEKEEKIKSGRSGDRNQEKYLLKSIQELDLSKCKKCSPGYRLLPKDHPLHSTKKRTEHELQVLNDSWVSVPSAIDQDSAHNRHPTQHEELMFQCEDERFELDMLINWYKSACCYAEELLKDTEEDKIEKIKRIQLRRSIERLYGDHGPDVLDSAFHRNATTLLAVITRLKQKVKELEEYQSDLNRTWADVFAKKDGNKRKRMQKDDDLLLDDDV